MHMLIYRFDCFFIHQFILFITNNTYLSLYVYSLMPNTSTWFSWKYSFIWKVYITCGFIMQFKFWWFRLIQRDALFLDSPWGRNCLYMRLVPTRNRDRYESYWCLMLIPYTDWMITYFSLLTYGLKISIQLSISYCLS